MVAEFLSLVLLSVGLVPAAVAAPRGGATAAVSAPAVAAPADTTSAGAARADSAAAPAARDTGAALPRVVRRFPPVEVRALFHDLNSSETVHVVEQAALRGYPVSSLAEMLALQPGVVAQAEELHVRGGRVGETAEVLDGVSLSEPLRGRPLDVPLLALRSAELVSGAPEAQYASGLAGTLDLHTLDPSDRASGAWRWASDGGLDTRYDRGSAVLSAPLPRLGLGVVAAGDAAFDNTWLPALRTQPRERLLGIPLGWRAENRLSGYLKLAPVARPERFKLQVLANRQVHEPYDPAWSFDGWTLVPANIKESPKFSPVPLPGYQRYRAADHLPITDDRQLATLASISALRESRRATLTLGWLRTRTVTSVSGLREASPVYHEPETDDRTGTDPFHNIWGDYPLYRESGSDVFTLRGDAEKRARSGSGLEAGAGVTYEEVTMREYAWNRLSKPSGGDQLPSPFDTIRAYRAFAPGGFAYAQGRWLTGGLILNLGLRADYFTAGPQADDQTLPGNTRGFLMLSPRLGVVYPVSVRDVFSLAYARIAQAPARDFLYDGRVAITNRQPLGNPGLAPATLITYEAALKHVFGPEWALQTSVFYRDLFNQVGARDYQVPGGPIDLRYDNSDNGHALGFEWCLIHSAGERGRFEAAYTWLEAWGYESRPEGDPYGLLREARVPPTGDTPLTWDRRHSILLSGSWGWRERWRVSWSTAVGSPLPWTPKPRQAPFTDLTLVNGERFDWSEVTNLNLEWQPPRALGLAFGLEVRNLFDTRGERLATVDGYPNPHINTEYDDYSAYRTETGLTGGAYWYQPKDGSPGYWVPVHDPRLFNPPRAVRMSVGRSW